MLLKGRATLLSAESKPWEIDGRSGVSHKARFNVEGEIYPLRTTEKFVETLKTLLEAGQPEGDIEFSLTAPKENIKVELVNFTPD